MVEFESQAKNHYLHRPMEKYFTDKFEKKIEAEKEAKMSKASLQEDESYWQSQFSKIGRLIQVHRSRVFVCLPCRQKFTDYEYFRLHERASMSHKENVERLRGEREEAKQREKDHSAGTSNLLQIQLSLNDNEVAKDGIMPPPPPPDDD